MYSKKYICNMNRIGTGSSWGKKCRYDKYIKSAGVSISGGNVKWKEVNEVLVIQCLRIIVRCKYD